MRGWERGKMQVADVSTIHGVSRGRVGHFAHDLKKHASGVGKREIRGTQEAVNVSAASTPAADGGSNALHSETASPRPPRADVRNMSSMRGERNSLDGIRGCSIQQSREASPRATTVTQSSFDMKRRGSPALLMQAATMNSFRRREKYLTHPDLYLQLCFEQQMRRHDPRNGMDRKGEDYVYYNHRSKGCYIPRDPPKDTLFLTYNHIAEYTDGSRFKRVGDAESPRPNPSMVEMRTGSIHSLKRVNKKELAMTAFTKEGYSIPTHSLFPTSPGRPKSQNSRTISVDLARSLHVSDLRIQPFRKHVIIEDVISKNSQRVSKVMEGVGSVVAKGKVNWNEIPTNLRRALSDEQIRHAATLESEMASAQTTGYRMDATGSRRYVADVSSPPSSLWVRDERVRPSSTVQQDSKRQQVAFTDHADRVLLGFAENIRSPVLMNSDGRPPCQLMSIPEENIKPENRVEGIAGPDSVHNTPQLPRDDNPVQALDSPSQNEERPVLLPPVAIAAMRDAAWFDPVGSRTFQSDEVPVPWSSRLPEKPLPFETSRLQYCRNHDVGGAKPPQAMMHWSQARKLL
ncbi:hypothetical protein MOQ_002185 [Trypanosoma cruzi marinkellei]|uniref:Uncharacterized protein n=1 Tax=Trypanosoma cruzi marinkellei TaxID=85056 RepID=K2NIS7_TRYCR|nr:hypothetical protein MOQ_002185 [Trypanosoma cruzi marinkellei]